MEITKAVSNDDPWTIHGLIAAIAKALEEKDHERLYVLAADLDWMIYFYGDATTLLINVCLGTLGCEPVPNKYVGVSQWRKFA